jgi:hypothetical protein
MILFLNLTGAFIDPNSLEDFSSQAKAFSVVQAP